MRNCTRLYYVVQHWCGNSVSVNPHKFKDYKAARRMFNRFPKDHGDFKRNHWTTQMDARGCYKGKYIRVCTSYWSNGKIVIQNTLN